MKFKSILLCLLLPLSVFGATNAFDNVKINTSLKLNFGSVSAGRILTSDANGMASWSNAPVSAAGGDVFKASNNVFSVSNTFQQGITVRGTNSYFGSTTNRFGPIGGTNLVIYADTGGVIYFYNSLNIGNANGYIMYTDSGNAFLNAPSGSIRLQVGGSDIIKGTSSLLDIMTNTVVRGNIHNLGKLTNAELAVFQKNVEFTSNYVHTLRVLPQTLTNNIDWQDGPNLRLSATQNVVLVQGTVFSQPLTNSSTVILGVLGDTVDRTLTVPAGWVSIGSLSTVISSNKWNFYGLTAEVIAGVGTNIFITGNTQP